ncbi:MAG: hypothetical protein SGARI_007029 [Bacillariaceae sp.]
MQQKRAAEAKDNAMQVSSNDVSLFPSHIDIVVCNAGIHTGLSPFYETEPATTKQGYDLTFGVNYLSHFLLTEKLLLTESSSRNSISSNSSKTTSSSLLNQSSSSKSTKIVHVTSSFHFAVDGSDLRVGKANIPPNIETPIAALPGGSHGFFFFKSTRQYANSKLAQILQARYYNTYGKLRSTTACPAWVGTDILQAPHDSWISKAFRYTAFPVEGYGISSVLAAMFVDGEHNGEDFFVSTKMSHMGSSLDGIFAGEHYSYPPSPRQKLSYQWLPIRDIMVSAFAYVVMLPFQSYFPAVMETSLSSKATFDTQLQEDLYQWSKQAVQEWF